MATLNDDVPFSIRFPPELHRSLRILAAYRGVSTNKLIRDVLNREVESARVQIPTL